MFSSTFCRHLCAASSGVVLLALFNYGRGKQVELQCRWRCCPSTSLLLGYRCSCSGEEAEEGQHRRCWSQTPFPYRSWRVPERPLLRMPHTDGGETSRRTSLNIRRRPSNPLNKIIHSTYHQLVLVKLEALNSGNPAIRSSFLPFQYWMINSRLTTSAQKESHGVLSRTRSVQKIKWIFK